MNFTIRPATAADAAAVFAVTRDSVAGLATTHYTPAQIGGWMGDRTPATYLEGCESGRIRVAEQEGRVVGFVDAVPGEITRLFLLPGVARQGLGCALMEVGLALARAGGAATLRIGATLNAVPFYAKFGFVPVGQSHFGGRQGDWPPIAVTIMERSAD
ncbi:MAG TPA: GNAT family N-acetyltransferase [Kiloniellales bacterium]|nr:GNAT family N-acetyltransferase [Kiloniellales bacterium]